MLVFWYLVENGRTFYFVYAYLHVGTRVIVVNMLLTVFVYYDYFVFSVLSFSPTPSFATGLMDFFSDWVAPLHPQRVSGSGVTALRFSSSCRWVMSFSLKLIANAIDCGIMR